MRISVLALVCGALAGASLAACAPRAILLEGDDKSVEIGYANDVSAAMPIAVQHCAGYARVPRLVSQTMDIAYFDCVAR